MFLSVIERLRVDNVFEMSLLIDVEYVKFKFITT